MNESQMSPWQKRVYDEKLELDDKILKLEKFIQDGTTFNGLPRLEQKRLSRQLVIMELYSEVLADRCDAFEPVKQPEPVQKPVQTPVQAQVPGRKRWIRFVGARDNGNTHLKLVDGKVVESLGGSDSVKDWSVIQNPEKVLDHKDVVDITELIYELCRMELGASCQNCAYSVYVKENWVKCKVNNFTTLDTYQCSMWDRAKPEGME